jgi:hypothetical protein
VSARGFHAKSVAQCWRIARSEARAFQRMLSKTPRRNTVRTAICLAARDSADRIALKIRYGTTSNVDNIRRKNR